MFLYRYYKGWRKNPQWSWSCCVALLLPLNDFQGEISGLAETNILQNQLQTEEIEMPTILAALEDSGAIDVTIEKDEHANETAVEIQDKHCQDSEYTDTKRHQETQTELFSLLSVDLVVKEPSMENGKNVSEAIIKKTCSSVNSVLI